MKKLILVILITAIIVGGGAFYGGMKYGQNKNFTRQPSSNLQNTYFQNRQPQQFGAADRGVIVGDILSKDDKSITVKLRDGGSKIILFSDSIEIVKSVNGTINDLEIGKAIMI